MIWGDNFLQLFPSVSTMSLCRGRFFFINNTSILSAGLKTTLKEQVCSGSLIQTGRSRSAVLSHYIKSTFRKSDHTTLTSLNGRPRVDLTKRFFSTSALRQLESTKKSSVAATADSFVMPGASSSGAESSQSKPESSQSKSSSESTSKWPINTAKPVGYLCIGTSVLVFAIVVLGGLTRLTESGLSITEWKPVTGAIPPLSLEDWEAEFDKYKQSPEFKELNSDISLDEYKFIYSMEWSHRLLGRLIGTVFVLPTLYYIARRKVSPPTAFKLLGICSLLGLQGFIGWWMVYSGIDKQQLEDRRSKPTVSPYRLATHLATAFTVYCCMISTGFSILRDHKVMANPEQYQKIFQQVSSPSFQRFIRLTKGLFGLVFFTAMTGALVAGLDAGFIYNTFPKMGENYIPPKTETMDPLYSRREDKSDLFWRNMLENPVTVQFNHRIMAMTTFCSVFALHMYSHRIKTTIPKSAYRWLNVSMGLVTLQLALGISTLIYIVPTDIAAAHQAGALALLTGMLMVMNNLKKPTKSNIILLQKFLKESAKNPRKKLE